jgi:glycosyltransferase involved in cell wall biosynthesis
LKISFTGPAMRFMDRNVGYGEASHHIIKSFKKLGLDVELEAKKADIEISFADPGNYTFYDPSSYKIGYSAWESSEMSQKFKQNIDKCDELWGTSFWISDIYKKLFPTKNIFTYQHGISESWKPKLRKNNREPFTFLHIGEPFSRKDAQIVVDSFVELFGHDPRYRLVLKCHKINTTRVKHPRGYDLSPAALYDNIVEISGTLSEEQMIGLYDQSDVFVYPSWGEGFGFQPLQALAMGMPVICVDEWADYDKFITWPVKSKWKLSPWQSKHPGYMLEPDKESLKNQMLKSVEEYNKVLPETFRNSFDIHREYDWIEVTKPAVARLKQIYANILIEKEYFDLERLKNKM